MASPRASSFWANSARMSSFHDSDSNSEDLEHQPPVPDYDPHDGRTPLDKTIDRIGMGSYQWTLLSLCGFGWMADNMWIQAVAIILPRVQRHYSVPDSYIGGVSSSMFAGMMFGAVGWGTCSDLMGRIAVFNATLFFTSLFGLLASFTNSFLTLCIVLFFLGSAVGGSMPTDGTLLLEHMPKGKQYFVTALSVFFSLGSVLAAVVALFVIPQSSCPPSSASCDIDTENQGWKYLLVALGLITLLMFLARILFFRLHESPRYLVHAGRPQEALVSLQMISRFNGSDLTIELDDVDDHHPQAPSLFNDDQDARTPFLANGRDGTPFIDQSSTKAVSRERLPETTQCPPSVTPPTANIIGGHADVKDYRSTHESLAQLDSQDTGLDGDPELTVRTTHVNPTPVFSVMPIPDPIRDSPSSPSIRRPRTGVRQRSLSESRYSHLVDLMSERAGGKLPRWIRKPLRGWLDRVALVLSPAWLRTTVLVWLAWCSMALAYTMFNVYLPKLLETGTDADNLNAKTLEDTLWDVVIYTIGGCPGAILGAYLVETRLGRRRSLAGSTFSTAFLCVVFVLVDSPLAVRASTVGISLSSTTMWAVLYGWTPDIFCTKVRGTACGIASALSRIGGMVAPILGGLLLMIHRSVPVYTSVVVFVMAGICVLLLKENGATVGMERERITTH